MRLPLFLVAQLCLLRLTAQTDTFIKDQGITSSLHQANIGRILFTSSDIPLTQLGGKDGLTTYELTNKSSLFITVFMDRSSLSAISLFFSSSNRLSWKMVRHCSGNSFMAFARRVCSSPRVVFSDAFSLSLFLCWRMT